MKKIVIVFISILMTLFVLILYVDYSDSKNIRELKNKIINNTNIKDIRHINYDGNNYIVLDNDNLYVFDNKYTELLKIDTILIHENSKKYDIIYKDGIALYVKDYYKDNKLYFEYYDLYTYELIDRFLVGGKNE